MDKNLEPFLDKILFKYNQLNMLSLIDVLTFYKNKKKLENNKEYYIVYKYKDKEDTPYIYKHTKIDVDSMALYKIDNTSTSSFVEDTSSILNELLNDKNITNLEDFYKKSFLTVSTSREEEQNDVRVKYTNYGLVKYGSHWYLYSK